MKVQRAGSEGVCSNHTSALFDDDFLIRRLVLGCVYLAGRPSHHDRIHPGGRAQAEVQTRIAGRLEAAVRAYLVVLRQASSFDFNPRTESVTIRALADTLNAQPMTCCRGPVAE